MFQLENVLLPQYLNFKVSQIYQPLTQSNWKLPPGMQIVKQELYALVITENAIKIRVGWKEDSQTGEFSLEF